MSSLCRCHLVQERETTPMTAKPWMSSSVLKLCVSRLDRRQPIPLNCCRVISVQYCQMLVGVVSMRTSNDAFFFVNALVSGDSSHHLGFVTPRSESSPLSSLSSCSSLRCLPLRSRCQHERNTRPKHNSHHGHHCQASIAV